MLTSTQGGGTIFCKKAYWELSTFPRQIFHESRSRRGPVLLHSKMAITLFTETPSTANDDDSDDELIILDANGKAPVRGIAGWVYVGSHNFTPSAWGTLSGSSFTPILNVTNYELGIVLPLRTKEADRFACYERPLKKYASGASPWVSPHLERWCSATYTLDRCRRIVYITSFQTINSTPAIGLYRLSYFQHNDPYCMHTI